SVRLQRAHLTLHPDLSEGAFDGAFQLVNELGDGKGGRAIGRSVEPFAGIEGKGERTVPPWHGATFRPSVFPSFRLTSPLAACSSAASRWSSSLPRRAQMYSPSRHRPPARYSSRRR